MKKIALLFAILGMFAFAFSCSHDEGEKGAIEEEGEGAASPAGEGHAAPSSEPTSTPSSEPAPAPQPEPFDVMSTTPTDGAADVAVRSGVSITFNRDIKWDTVTDDSVILQKGEEKLRTKELQCVGAEVTFSSERPFDADTNYSVTVLKTVADTSGAVLEGDYTFSFKTGAPPVVAFSVAGTTPEPGALNVALSTQITVTFNKLIKCDVINSDYVKLEDSTGSPVSLTKRFCDARSVMFDPNAALDLLPNTTYTVTIRSGVYGANGERLESPCIFEFNTVSE